MDESISSEDVGVQDTRSEDLPDIYANSTSMTVSTYDVLFRFYQQDFDEQTASVEKRLVGKVRMSHSQAWVFVKKLNRLLDQQIHDVGPIHLPEALIRDHDLEAEYSAMHGSDEEV